MTKHWAQAAVRELRDAPPRQGPGARAWYSIDPGRLPGRLGAQFLRLGLDRSTRGFLEDCHANFWRGALTELFVPVLRVFFSITDTNALLGRGDMFVLSTDQALALLGGVRPGGTLLDVGAGDGNVTRQVSRHHRHRQPDRASSSRMALDAAHTTTCTAHAPAPLAPAALAALRRHSLHRSLPLHVPAAAAGRLRLRRDRAA